MIRSVPTAAQFMIGRRRRLGQAGIAGGAISAGVNVATDALNLWMNSIQLSHNADTATTLIVNGLAQQLGNLVNAYMAEPNPTCADQRAALDAYDEAWLWLQSPQACGAPAYGSAGNRCISDRAPGGKYPWQTYYRDPIANDPRLSGAGCDTGQTVVLPTVSTGYQPTDLTSTGGNPSTGQPAGVTPAQSLSAASTTQTSPNYLLIGAAALAAVLIAKAL